MNFIKGPISTGISFNVFETLAPKLRRNLLGEVDEQKKNTAKSTS